MKELSNIINGANTKSVNLTHLARLTLFYVDLCCSCLSICSIAAIAVDQACLASLCQRHKLNRGVSTNLTRVCNYLQSLKTRTVTNVLVSNLLLVIALLQRLLICREGISVFHNELTATHKTKTWTTLVTELILNLIERYRKLLITLKLVSNKISESFLVSWTKSKLTIMAVMHTHELVTIDIPTTRLFPELSGGHNRNKNLLSTNTVHLIANDGLNL